MFKWYYQKLGKYGIEIKDKKTTKISKINQSIDEYYFRNLYGKSFSVQDNANRRIQYSKKNFEMNSNFLYAISTYTFHHYVWHKKYISSNISWKKTNANICVVSQ